MAMSTMVLVHVRSTRENKKNTCSPLKRLWGSALVAKVKVKVDCLERPHRTLKYLLINKLKFGLFTFTAGIKKP